MRTTFKSTTTVERIPVVIHASDPITRAGAVSQLRQRPEVELVGETRGSETRTNGARAGEARPGETRDGVRTVAVVLADRLDETTMLRLRRLVRTDGLNAVLVTGVIREAELLQVIECGVGAILWRHEATDQRLLQAVVAAARGEGDLPSDLLGRLINQVGRLQRNAAQQPGGSPAGLAPREIDILRLVSEGMDTREIAGKLSYSERTVKNVLHGLTTRLQLRNRAHAVAYALREGYI
ncbi:response regulator transcription factor [Streptomyces sp. WAC 00631]|uniref:helix-turn-helix transcriptional regulator n=1 Tax=Streptomyces sp. WAC 00631 TaxID=2203201 RepID=UPI001E649D29|nr:response regulator transcription factor [Streptomyces sp. WAC 00631]MCC5033453.1 response regulator transcription factor [Streptomyces sp. WAC 00631]